MTVKTRAAMSSGSQPPCVTLTRLRGEEDQLDAAEGDRRPGPAARSASATAPRDDEQQDRVDEQRAGDRDAVGRGEPFGGLERQDEHEDADEERPLTAGR